MIKSHAQFVFGAGWHREGLIHGHRCILWMDGRIWTVTLDLSLPFEQPWAKASLERVSISEGWCWRPDRYWLVKLMWPSNWADGSRWCCVGGPQHLSSFLPTMSASQPPFVLPIPAGYFYHGGKKVMLFLSILPWNKSHQLPWKSTQQMALVPCAQKNSKPPGMSEGF